MSNEEVYCICRKPEHGPWMVQCDKCHEWFHKNCVGLKRRPSSRASWLCPGCKNSLEDDRAGSNVQSTSVATSEEPTEHRAMFNESLGYTILSLNLDSSIDSYKSLKQTVKQEKPLALCLQDLPMMTQTEFKQQTSGIAPNYQLFTGKELRTHSNGKIKLDCAILVRSDVSGDLLVADTELIPLHSVLGVILCLQLESGKTRSYAIYSVYVRPDLAKNAQQDDQSEGDSNFKGIESILRYIESTSSDSRLRQRRIILGDFNALSPEWSPIDIKLGTAIGPASHMVALKLNRGRRILQFIKRLKLNCLNDLAGGPTFRRRDQSSYVDLALVGTKALRQYKSFSLIKPGGLTCHMMVKISAFCNEGSRSFYYKTSDINHKMFHKLRCTYEWMAFRWERLGSSQEIIEYLNILVDQLYKLLLFIQNRIRRAKHPRKNNSIQYRNHKVTRLINKLKKFKQLKARSGKIGYWCRNSPTRIKNQTLACKMVQKLSRSLRSLIDNDSGVETQNVESSESLVPSSGISKLAIAKFPRCKRNFWPLCKPSEKRSSINSAEIKLAIEQLSKKACHDHYGLSYAILAQTYKFIPFIINGICKMSFHVGQLPETRQLTQGIIMPKKKPGQFRIVQVSSAVMALLEIIANHRLQYIIERNGLSSHNQYAYTKGRDRYDLLARIYASMHYESNHLTRILVQLDIESAFDSLNHDSLAQVMIESMGDEPILSWLLEFIYKRKIAVRLQKAQPKQWSHFRQIYRGIPQGSALAPTLWNLATSRILLNKHCVPGQLELLAYADDLFVLQKTQNRNLHKAQNDLELLLVDLETKLRQFGLRINSEKGIVWPELEINEGHLLRRFAKSSSNNLGVSGIPIGLHLKPSCNILSTYLAKSLQTNCRKMYSYVKLGAIHSPKEWQDLAQQYLVSSTVNSFLPVLAIHKAGRNTCDQMISRALKTIFSFATGISGRTIHLFIRYPGCNSLVERWIETKLVTCEDLHQPCYLHLKQLFQESSSSITTSLPNSRSDVKLHCFNPELILETIPLQSLNIYKRSSAQKWFVFGTNEHALAILLGHGMASALDCEIVRHQAYSYGHNNTIALVYSLIANRTIDSDEKNIILSDKCSVVAALTNYCSQNATIIELKERLIDGRWKIYTLENEQFCTIKETILEYCRYDIVSTPTRFVNEPNFQSEVELARIRAMFEQRTEEYYSSCLSDIMRTIHPDYKAWQSVPINFVSNVLIYNLTGFLPSNGFARSSCEPQELPLDCKAEDNCAMMNRLGDIILHRMFECPRFVALRRDCFKDHELTGLSSGWNKIIYALALSNNSSHRLLFQKLSTRLFTPDRTRCLLLNGYARTRLFKFIEMCGSNTSSMRKKTLELGSSIDVNNNCIMNKH